MSRTVRTLVTTGLAAATLTLGVAFAPAAAAADSTNVFVTDTAGDARAQGIVSQSANTPTVDLVRLDVLRDAAALTATVRAGAVDPTRNDIYSVTIYTPDGTDRATYHLRIASGSATLTVRDNNTSTETAITATPVFDTAAGTVRAVFPRAQVDAATAAVGSTPLSTVEPLYLGAAAQGRAPGLLGGTAHDEAGEFPSV